jgi:hypothetical protein
MNRLKLWLIPFAILSISCGIEESYYLPQVPSVNINRNVDTEADIIIPPINPVDFFYFTDYAIFYRIYVSETPISLGNPGTFTTELRNDFNAISPYTNPASISVSSSIDQLFRARGYFELSFVGENNSSMMPMTGGVLNITFPTNADPPFATLRNSARSDIQLARSINNPVPDNIFINTLDLRTDTRNTDVSRRAGDYAYVSMYIVAKGFDSVYFLPIFSKPTHIHIFQLF